MFRKLYDQAVWFFNNQPFDVVDQLYYLGLAFNYNGKFTVAQKLLATQREKASFLLIIQMKEFIINTETKLSMFDTYVGPILNYACEVWGYHRTLSIEKVTILFLKKDSRREELW